MAEQWTNAQARVLNQFRGSPNLLALLEAVFDRIDNIEEIFESLRDERDIDNSEGVWLDIVGDIVGLERPHFEQDYSTIFAFKGDEDDVDDPFKGFADYGSTIVTNGNFVGSINGWTVTETIYAPYTEGEDIRGFEYGTDGSDTFISVRHADMG